MACVKVSFEALRYTDGTTPLTHSFTGLLLQTEVQFQNKSVLIKENKYFGSKSQGVYMWVDLT